MSHHSSLPPRQGLYDPANEHDACLEYIKEHLEEVHISPWTLNPEDAIVIEQPVSVEFWQEDGFFKSPKQETIYKGFLAVWKIIDPDLRIFLKVSEETKIKYIVETKNIDISDAKKLLEEEENKEKNYYVNNYGINIKDYSGFDLVINMDKIDADGIIGVIEKYLNKMKK